MIISEIKNSEELVTLWETTRKKSVRFQILENPYCPNSLVYKALFLYDPEKVLNIPAISVKYMWLIDDSKENSILKDCLELVNGEIGSSPKAYSYHFAKEYNLLFYLECVYAQNNPKRQIECITSLNSRAYIERIALRNPDLLKNLIQTYTLDQQTNLGANLYTHLYAKKLIDFNLFKFLCQTTFNSRAKGLFKVPTEFDSLFWTTGTQSIRRLFVDDRIKNIDDLKITITEIFNLMSHDNRHGAYHYGGVRLYNILRFFEEEVDKYNSNITPNLRVWFGSENYHKKPL